VGKCLSGLFAAAVRSGKQISICAPKVKDFTERDFPPVQGRSGTQKSTGTILTAPAHNKPTTGPNHPLHLPYINYTNKMYGLNGNMTKNSTQMLC